MRHLTLVLISFFILHLSATAQSEGKFIAASDSHIQYVGRFSFKDPKAVAFTYPGVQINARFTGTSVSLYCKPGSGYFMAQVDGGLPVKVDLSQKSDSIALVRDDLGEGTHELRLMYAIEGYSIKPAFKGLFLDADGQIKDAPERKQRRIEFIGNSITCGYGLESNDPHEGFSYETENHYWTYAAQTARALNAEHLVVARSGIGIYRNYGGPKQGSKDCMPRMYDQVLFNQEGEYWDYTRYTPDVVLINLGTNDTSQDLHSVALLKQGYIGFIRQIRSHYPDAKIVLLSGTMLNGGPLRDVQKAMDRAVSAIRKEGDRNVYRYDMQPQDGSLGYGADYHPNRPQQSKMAKELTAYLQKLMNWD